MKKTLQNLLVFLLFLAGSAITAKGDDLVLASSSSNATIVIGTNATETEKYAAEELQRCVRIMSGIELPIVSNGSAAGAQIVIGTPAGNSMINDAKVKLNLDGSNDEQIAVLRDGNILYVGGQTARAALYATYTLLQDVLGVRWFWPGDSGEFIPKRDTVSVGALSIFEVPDIATRSLAITSWGGGNPETDAWKARNRLNTVGLRRRDASSPEIHERLRKGFQARISGHFIVLPEEILSAHPEYAALYNGSRSYSTANRAQLCWGNPGVQDEVANLLKGLWEEFPFMDAICFFPADNQTYCTDELCKALAPDVSTRWQKFSQIVMEKVDVTYPGKTYWTIAYQGFKEVPQTVASRFKSIAYTLYEASYRHLLSSGYSGSAGAIAEIDGWIAKGADMGIRGYEYIMFRDPMFVPLVSWETDQMAWIADKGLTNYSSELPAFNAPKNAAPEDTYWMCNRMNLYAAARGAWDSEISPDSLVRDWCETIYGPAADEMIAYYWDIENAWRTAPGDIQEYNKTPASQVNNFLSPEVFVRLNGYFTRARTKLKEINDPDLRERAAEQIDLESKMLAKWQAIYNFKNNRASHFEAAIEKVENLNNATWNNVLKLPAFEDQTGQAVAEQTQVSKAWTETDLNFRIVCKDDDIGSRIANATVDDDVKITMDDCIELYIQADPNNAAYMHFAINTLGKKYDAISTYGGTDFDKSWNPEWTATASVGTDGWEVDIKIPFSSLGISAQDSSQFKMAIKRSRAGRTENSGWPDASYFNPASFGLVTLVSEIPNPAGSRVILYDQGGTKSGNVSTEFQQRGWQVVSGLSGEDQLSEKLEEDAAVLVLRSGSDLSNDFYLNEITNYLEKGRVVIISTAGNIPIDEWFPGTPAVVWSGYNQNLSASRISYQLPGAWQTYPNDLSSEITRRPTPVTAYIPQSEGWRELLKMPMKNGSDLPFLLSRRIGNGLLVLTSSNMGYSGGYEMFGNRRITNAVKLVENFVAERNAFPEIKRAQKITLDSIPDKVFGEPDFAVTATSDADLPVTLSSSDSAVAIISNGMVHLTGVGTTIITASQEGNEIYEAAEQVSRELEVIADVVPPSTPGALSATATDSTVTLSWDPSSDFIGVIGYGIYTDDKLIGTFNTTIAEVGGLQAFVSYTFKVIAMDAAGNESPASVLTVTTPDTQAPEAPVLTGAKSNKHRFNLKWDPAIDNVGVIGYYIYRNGILLDTTLITGTHYRAERPRGKDVYAFSMKALDAAGNRSPSSNIVVAANGSVKDGTAGSRKNPVIADGFQIESNDAFIIYPNPSSGNFKVRVDTDQDGRIEIAIFNASGVLIQSIQSVKEGPYQKGVNVSDLAPGTYIIRVRMNGFSKSKTITIQ